MDILDRLQQGIHGNVRTPNNALLADASDEIQTLRAKVASAEVLVEALRGLVNDLRMRADFGQDDAQGVVACGNTVWCRATEALATYDKQSEVNHDTK